MSINIGYPNFSDIVFPASVTTVKLTIPFCSATIRSIEPPITRNWTSLPGSRPIFLRPTLRANSAVVPAIWLPPIFPLKSSGRLMLGWATK